jgi:hypothetical protein
VPGTLNLAHVRCDSTSRSSFTVSTLRFTAIPRHACHNANVVFEMPESYSRMSTRSSRRRIPPHKACERVDSVPHDRRIRSEQLNTMQYENVIYSSHNGVVVQNNQSYQANGWRCGSISPSCACYQNGIRLPVKSGEMHESNPRPSAQMADFPRKQGSDAHAGSCPCGSQHARAGLFRSGHRYLA